MKTVKQILEHRTVIKTGILAEGKKLKKADETKIPTVIVLQRKAIRVFPDDQKIALYYSQALDKHVSIPFSPKNDALGIHLSEETLDEIAPIPIGIGMAARAALPYVARGLGAAAGAAAKGASKATSKVKDYLAKRAAKKAAEKKSKESPLSGSKEAFEKGTPKKDSGLRGKYRRWREKRRNRRGGGAGGAAAGAATGGAGAWLASKAAKALANRDPRGAFKSAEGEHQFGRELAKMSGPQQATIDPSAAAQQRRAFGGPQGYYRESTNLSKIKTIVESKTKRDEITFQDGKSVEITGRVAKKILGIYESLNKDNKKNLEKMLNEDIVSFRKVVNFAIRQ